MSKTAVVIGGGHNGLTAATKLATEGFKVLCLEASGLLGGLARSEPFAEGFYSGGLHHDTASVRPEVVRDLGLEKQGLRFEDGFRHWTAPSRERDSIYVCGKSIVGVDAEVEMGFQRWCNQVERLSQPLRHMLTGKAPDPLGPMLHLVGPALNVRRLSLTDRNSLIRIPPMAVADWHDAL